MNLDRLRRRGALMAFINPIAGLAGWLGWYVVPFIVILSAIVFVHELGHYLVGR